MAWQSTPFTFPLLVITGVFLAVLVVGVRRLRRDPPPATRPFLVVVAAGVVWTGTYAVELAATDLSTKLAVARVIWVAIATIAVFWPAFALSYVGQVQRVSRGLLAALAVVPGAFVLLLFAPAGSNLVFVDPYLRPMMTFVVLDYTIGPGLWAFITYLYAVFAVVILMIGRLALSAHGSPRWQAAIVFVAGTMPVLASVISLFELVPIGVIDLTPISFAVSAVLIAVALFRYGLLEVVPVSESAVLEELDAGVLVVDTAGRVVTANSRLRSILGLGEAPVVGRVAADLLASHPELQVAVEHGTETTFDLTMAAEDAPDADGPTTESESVPDTARDPEVGDGPEPDESRGDGGGRGRGEAVYEVSVSPAAAAGGTVVSLRDVTERDRREAMLRRQKEQLDTFASVVSHDLRSPLSVARGYLEFARETGDEADFEKVIGAHERMDRLLDDLLTLARQGESIEDPEPVDLADVVTAAWGSVDTVGATLSYEADADLVVEGDRGRLQQAFENLFKNSIEHGTGDGDVVGGVDEVPRKEAEDGTGQVTVTVGQTEDGFFVADDGPGIPEDDRETVFEYGFSTAEEGTGIGLDIVDRIIRAHGWTIRATESADGGARFEVRGVGVA